MSSLRFRFPSSGVEDEGLGKSVEGKGFKVLELKVWGLEFRVKELGLLGFRV